MSDSLSHSCPTCAGTGWADKGELVAKVRAAKTGKRVAVAGAECPDCIDGYPKAAVERAAKASYEAWWEGRKRPWKLIDEAERELWIEQTLAAIRAFHDEGSEGE